MERWRSLRRARYWRHSSTPCSDAHDGFPIMREKAVAPLCAIARACLYAEPPLVIQAAPSRLRSIRARVFGKSLVGHETHLGGVGNRRQRVGWFCAECAERESSSQ